jgi:hypothetical protein
MLTSRGFGTRRGPVRRLAVLVLAAITVAAMAACESASPAPPGTAPPGTAPASPAASTGPYCPRLFVPAYFYSSAVWAQAAGSSMAPSDMILDISGLGAGSQPDAHFQAVVSQARARAVTILGYISTVDGQRPAAQVEAEVRNYRAWYGVTGIFLDRVSGQAPQLGYYRQLIGYIHQLDPGFPVWLNPGVYPDRSYMSMGDVVEVFEGTYAQYQNVQVPGWVSSYPASKFAHTIYDTPSSALSDALGLAASRRAGHVYVTDASGSNPYDVLPSYWPREDAAASAGCAGR